MHPVVSIAAKRKAPFAGLALFIWASSIVLTVSLAALTAWMAVERSDPLSVMLAVLALICLVVGREAWQFTYEG